MARLCQTTRKQVPNASRAYRSAKYWSSGALALALTVQGDRANWPDVASLAFTALTIGATEYLRANLEDVVYAPGSRTFAWDSTSVPFVDGENSIVIS